MINTTTLPGLLKISRPPLDAASQGQVVDFASLAAHLAHPFVFKQVNHSHSVQGVLRGLHAEQWDKIVWVGTGRALSVIVDIRPDSLTFGKHETFEISSYNRQALYIPQGFANSAYALTEMDYFYMVSKTYDGSDTTAVAWDDPDLAIEWYNPTPIISQRDRTNPRLRELFPHKFK